MNDESEKPFLTIDETADLLRVKRRTLDNLRWQKDGPPFRRHGGRIVYKRTEVLAWSEQRRARKPPSEGSQQPTPQRSGNDWPCSSRDYVAETDLAPHPLEYPSAPTGFYWLTRRPPSLGALAVTRLPDPLLGLAGARGYLPVGTLLIKRVAGAAGDVVCRHGAIVTINRRIVAYARTADAAARLLPRWSGCARLNAAQVFVLSPRPDSFDSRYFGPIDRGNILGTALPLCARCTGFYCDKRRQPDRQEGRWRRL